MILPPHMWHVTMCWAKYLVSRQQKLHHPVHYSSKAMIPTLSVIRDWFHRKQFFCRLGEWGGHGFGTIQVDCLYCSLYFSFVAISGHSALMLGLAFVLLWESNIIIDLTGGGAQAVMWPTGSGCKYRRNSAGLLTSCCVAWFLTGHGQVLVRGLGTGVPRSRKCLSRDLNK